VRYSGPPQNWQVIFRDATAADVAPIVALVESAYRGDASRAGWTTEADLLDGQRTDVASVTGIIASPDSRMLLALDDAGDLVACCQLERRDANVCYFGMFAVQPTLQAAGVGKAVLTEAERLARNEWGARSMQMTVIEQRADLIAWYLRRGYAVTGETRPFPHGDERFGLPRREDLVFVVLTKPLSD
jgi:ribosomal protein S18 acetylase RimI-like enzyme